MAPIESVSTSTAPDEQVSPTLSASLPDKMDTSTDQASTSTIISTNGPNNPGNTSTNEQLLQAKQIVHSLQCKTCFLRPTVVGWM